MGGINVGRWVLGGVVAGIVMWLVEGGSSLSYMADMEEAGGRAFTSSSES